MAQKKDDFSQTAAEACDLACLADVIEKDLICVYS